MRLLVTGATGALGLSVVKAFHKAGYSLRALSIDSPSTENWPDDVEMLIGDVTNPNVVRNAMVDVDAVVHMAALLHIVDPPEGLGKKYERVNLGGTRTVVEEAIRADVQRVLFFSTIAVYGRSQGCLFNETSLTSPETVYAQTKLSAERIVLSAIDKNETPIGVVLRLGAVYGSCIKGNYKRMVQALAHNRFIPIGHGLNRRVLVYDKDVAEAAVLAVEHPEAAGHVYNVTDGDVHALNEIISAICRALGRKPPCFSLPVSSVRFAAGFLEQGARLCGFRSPITRATLDKYTEDIAVEGKLIQKELGFVPKYDLNRGWMEAVLEMRARGIL